MENSPPTLKSPFSFKLSAVFVLVGYFAVGLTALKMATHGWTVAVTSITALIFLAGLFRIVFGATSARTFWSGFTVCGGGYIVLLLIMNWCDSSPSSPNRMRRRLVNDLATTEALDFLARKFNPEVEKHITANMPNPIFDYADYLLELQNGTPPAYMSTYFCPTTPSVTPAPGESRSDGPLNSPSPKIEDGTDASENNAAKSDKSADETDMGAVNVVAVLGEDPPATSDTPPAPPQPASPQPTPPAVWASPAYNPYLPYLAPPPTAPTNDMLDLSERLRNFPRIGHCLFALAFGWLGATLAVVFTRHRKPSPVSA